MTPGLKEDRYDRMKRIQWMDMDRIACSRCLVVGAGALGNEVLKCLTLAGFRDITIVDMDCVENSNLSRCVFFREEDNGLSKSHILAKRANSLSPDVNIKSIDSKIQEIEDWNYDMILGCLDNILARLHTNSHATYYGIPYVDGAINGMRGKIQTVLPGGPCLHCAINESHLRLMDLRFSCTGAPRTPVPVIPAEITTASIVAAMQVREAEKIASEKDELCVRDITFYDGVRGTMDTVSLDIDKDCPNHMVS